VYGDVGRSSRSLQAIEFSKDDVWDEEGWASGRRERGAEVDERTEKR